MSFMRVKVGKKTETAARENETAARLTNVKPDDQVNFLCAKPN